MRNESGKPLFFDQLLFKKVGNVQEKIGKDRKGQCLKNGYIMRFLESYEKLEKIKNRTFNQGVRGSNPRWFTKQGRRPAGRPSLFF